MAMRTRLLCVTLGLLLGTAAPAAAQGRGRGRGPKKYVVTNDRALVVTREVLVRHGYEVVRVEDGGPDVVVWYRRGNRGRGRGKGPPVKMVIRREADGVVLVRCSCAIAASSFTVSALAVPGSIVPDATRPPIVRSMSRVAWTSVSITTVAVAAPTPPSSSPTVTVTV